jgi:hypothetical protein
VVLYRDADGWCQTNEHGDMEADLPVTVSRQRQLEPFLSNPKPSFLGHRTDRLSCLLGGFLGLLAESD